MVELLVKKGKNPSDVLDPIKKTTNQAVVILAEGLDRLYRYWKVVSPRLDERVKRNYIILLTTILSPLLFGLWGIVPLLGSNTRLHREFKYGKDYEESLVERINALSEGRTTLSSMANDLETLDEVIPNTPLQAELIEELSIDGGTSGFSIRSISFSEKTTTNKIVSEEFECVFEGTKAGLVDLLEAVSKGRLIDVDKVRYSEQIVKEQEKLSLSLAGKSFYLKED
jgi:hypothetical protein